MTTVVSPAENHALVNGRRLAYVDFGGDGIPILAVVGHFGRARMFAPLAAASARVRAQAV